MSHASASLVRVREMLALYHMVERSEERTSVRSSSAWELGWIEEMTVAGVGGWFLDFSLRAAACCPAILPMTSPSRSEFEASRFAPWSPVQAASPMA